MRHFLITETDLEFDTKISRISEQPGCFYEDPGNYIFESEPLTYENFTLDVFYNTVEYYAEYEDNDFRYIILKELIAVFDKEIAKKFAWGMLQKYGITWKGLGIKNED